MFSTPTGYALRALAALPENGSYRLTKDLACQEGLPNHFLGKILQTLAKAGILESARGHGGGFRFARPAHRISIGEVVDAMEGPKPTSKCILGYANCETRNPPCPLHSAWIVLKNHRDETMAKVTIRDLQSLDRPNPPASPRRS